MNKLLEGYWCDVAEINAVYCGIYC